MAGEKAARRIIESGKQAGLEEPLLVQVSHLIRDLVELGERAARMLPSRQEDRIPTVGQLLDEELEGL